MHLGDYFPFNSNFEVFSTPFRGNFGLFKGYLILVPGHIPGRAPGRFSVFSRSGSRPGMASFCP